MSLSLGKFGNRGWVFEKPSPAVSSTFLNQRFGWFFILLCMYETRELTIGVPFFVVPHEIMSIQDVVYRIESSIGMLVRMGRPGRPGLGPCPSHLFATLLTTFSWSSSRQRFFLSISLGFVLQE